MDAGPTRPARRGLERWILAAGPLACAALSVGLGQSTAWDLRNYHWYNPYALLTGRMGFDQAVAHHATYYNPLIDLPLYGLAQVLPGWACAAALGAIQGLNFTFLYLIARAALSPEFLWPRPAAFALAALGVSGGYAIVLLGTTYYDNVVSVPVLASLWLILKHRAAFEAGPYAPASRAAILAGALTGFAVGLKLPTAPFGLALLAALLAARAPWPRRLRLTFEGGLAAFAGLMLAGGWWMAVLWAETGNPLFPYFNELFRSDLVSASSFRDQRFIPDSGREALLFPFLFAADWRVASDWPVQDWKIAAAYVLVPVAAIVAAIRMASTLPIVPWTAARILFAWSAAAYLSWIAVFGIARYVAPLEMIAPLLIVAAVGLLPLAPVLRGGLATAVLAACVLSATLYKGPRAPFADRMVEVEVPPIARPEATMALMTGVEPMAFVIPSFPSAVPFLRVDGFLIGPGADVPYVRRMIGRIDEHLARGGDLFTLFAWEETGRGDAALRAYGLARTEPCAPVRSNLTRSLAWCRVERAAR